MWDFSVIKDLLMNPVYTGAIASQKKNYRFKIGTINEKKPEEWIVVENQHEPIITKTDFDIVQQKLKSRQRSRLNGELSLFAGLIKCGECGKSLTFRSTHTKQPQRIYACKTYAAFGKKHCTQHRIDFDVLYNLVLEKIRECAAAALADSQAVADKLLSKRLAERNQQRENLECTLAKDEARVELLEKMVLKLYEDMLAGTVSEGNFNLMLAKTQKEQADLQARIVANRKYLADESQLACDTRQWIDCISNYVNITELDSVTLNRLIKEIVVHEKIDDDNIRHISVEIHFNLKPLPEITKLNNDTDANPSAC